MVKLEKETSLILFDKLYTYLIYLVKIVKGVGIICTVLSRTCLNAPNCIFFSKASHIQTALASVRCVTDCFFSNLTCLYSSTSISWPSHRPLAQILFKNLADKFEMPKFAKGHKSRTLWWSLFKSLSGINLLIILYQLTKFQAPSSNTSRYLVDKIFFEGA